MEIQIIYNPTNDASGWRLQFTEQHILPHIIGVPEDLPPADYQLLRGAYFKDLETVKKQLQTGARINAYGKSRETPFILLFIQVHSITRCFIFF